MKWIVGVLPNGAMFKVLASRAGQEADKVTRDHMPMPYLDHFCKAVFVVEDGAFLKDTLVRDLSGLGYEEVRQAVHQLLGVEPFSHTDAMQELLANWDNWQDI